MGRGPSSFKEGDLVRALKAAKKAGYDNVRAEVGRDGKIILEVFNRNGESLAIGECNEWDEQHGASQPKIR